MTPTHIPSAEAHTRSALVWIASGLVLLLYSGLGLWGIAIPGVEELVNLVNTIPPHYIFIAAFLSIFFEGLYIVGNFLPGSTLVLILAMVAQSGGIGVFLSTIGSVFLGWIVAGIVNIYITAAIIKKFAVKVPPLTIKDSLWSTWYPAFRANKEVADVVAGHPPHIALLSSLRDKIWASLGVTVYALVLPYFVDMTTINNSEGFFSVLIIAGICFAVGVWQWRSK
ncbi:MAG: hypothetical protein RLZZ70_541 [Candidatus Parcubacteria bacterium]|jgi:hypothetical protein